MMARNKIEVLMGCNETTANRPDVQPQFPTGLCAESRVRLPIQFARADHFEFGAPLPNPDRPGLD